MTGSLIIFDTHPIQYRAPVFRVLAQKLPGFKVCFFNSQFNGKKWWFQEWNKIPKQEFGLSLEDGYEHVILKTEGQSLLKKIQEIRKVIKTEQPQAILVFGYYQVEHWILRYFSSRYGIPLLFIGETFDWRGHVVRKKLKRHLVQWFFKSVSGFVSIGKKNETYYSKWGIPKTKITSGHYCTDPTPFILSAEKAQGIRTKTRESLGVPENGFVLLFVGRLFQRKRPQDLLEMHRALQNKGKVYTIFVGNGEMQDWLQEQTQAVPNAIWVGFKNQKELIDYYYAADLLVVPSEFETWGLVVNEAFSCELPALVTNACGVAEDLVISKQTGEIYTVGRVEEAVAKLEPLLENPSLVKEWGKTARKKILESFNPEQFASSILQAFQKAI
ncbi:glycosyltransferase [bacterium]|nr:glycosyltransferase [bacterium]